jgi:hypothetical protein
MCEDFGRLKKQYPLYKDFTSFGSFALPLLFLGNVVEHKEVAN